MAKQLEVLQEIDQEIWLKQQQKQKLNVNLLNNQRRAETIK